MDLKDSIAQLDIAVKARALTGKSFWETREIEQIGMPSVKLSDGPNGMRVQVKSPNHVGMGGSLPSTCFPTASAVACSFDEELCAEIGKRIGREAASLGVSMVLGPGLNIKRSPLCGRNFEYFSEDGYLSGKLAAAFVRGVQGEGVTACVKHFAVNNREYARMFYDSRVDMQTLRETYLTGFEIAVKCSKPGAVMTSYNMLNGEYCNQNKQLIRGILRGEWGFDGVVVSDWGGSHDPAKAISAGADLEMPVCPMSAARIVQAVESGELKVSDVNAAVERIYSFARRGEKIDGSKADFDEHSDFAARAAEECMVLLKNDGTLPLSKGERVAVVGDFAKTPRYQGAGSSQVVPTSLKNILDEIKSSGLQFAGFGGGFKRKGGASRRLARQALSVARKADTVIFCMGLDENGEAEGCDRADLNLNKNQIDLLKAISALGKKVVVLLFTGSAVDTGWDKYANSLLLCHLSGQGGARAAVKILTGEINPSGKLAESYPLKLSDVPCAEIYSSSPLKCDYAEGIYVGYKYYTAFDIQVKYPFGYGLSYTRFEYSGFAAEDGGVRFTVKNAGERDGATVAQVYVTAPRSNLLVSIKELKLFRRINLAAGEEREIFIPYDEYTFRVWEEGGWTAGGEYKISLCTDSAHPVFSVTKIIEGALPAGEKSDYESYFNSRISPEREYIVRRKGLVATEDIQVADLRYCRGIVAKIFALIARRYSRSKDRMKANVMDWLSVRSLMQFMKLNDVQAEGFLLACNGHFFKGMKKLLSKNKSNY